MDFNPHPAGSRLRDFTFNDFKWPARTGNLDSTHFWHNKLWLRGVAWLGEPQAIKASQGAGWVGELIGASSQGSRRAGRRPIRIWQRKVRRGKDGEVGSPGSKGELD